MGTFIIIGNLLFWGFLSYRRRYPKKAKSYPSNAPYNAEEREAIHGEVLLRMFEAGETQEQAKMAAEAMTRLYDMKHKKSDSIPQ